MIKLKVVVKSEEKIRLDKYLALSTDYTRSKIEKLLDEGKIFVNGRLEKASFKVGDGDEVELPDEVTSEKTIQGEEIELDILYEDDYIIVVNKPSGMVVHPGAGNKEHTLANALVGHTDKLSSENGDFRPGIVHRIDKDTSGVLLVAKNDRVHNILAEGFKNKTIKRVYVALLDGVFPNSSATVDAPIGRDKTNRIKYTVTDDEGAKNAITHLKVIKRYKNNTLVELRLETGRTHQIRVHMKYIGYPVHNDPLYGHSSNEFGQFLHAKSLEFEHPITKERMYFESPLPTEFKDFLDGLE